MRDLYKQLLNKQVFDYQIDSKKITENSLFFALKGEKTDGHNYLWEAKKNKAYAAVVSKGYKKDIPGFKLLRVNNVLGFLQEIAKESLKRFKGKIIAVTGSFGKTTTKEFIYQILKSKYKVSKTYSNYNSQRGFPLSILNMNKEVDFLVLEMGMDLKGEITKLVNIAPPDIAVVTSIVSYHNNFDSPEKVADAKAEILSHDNTKLCVINKKLLKYKAFQEKKCMSYSLDRTADFYIKENLICEKNKKYLLKTPFSERPLIENMLAAISVARIIGMSYEEIILCLKDLKTYKMRYEKVNINGVTFIKDMYNANFDAVESAIDSIENKTGRVILVLGSMLGLGPHSKKCHEIIAEKAKRKTSYTLFFGKEWLHIDNLNIFDSLAKLAKDLKKIIKKNDVVLVKGSRGMQMENLFNFI